MGKIIKIITTVCTVLIFHIAFTSNADADCKIGVLAKRGAPKTMKKWVATATYLSHQTGEKCSIIPLQFTAIEPAVASRKIDFLLANPSFYVEMEKKYNAQAIATMVNSSGGQAINNFGGVIFVRKDSPIKTLADIKGKNYMCVKHSSLGGAHMAKRLLLEHNIDPDKDTATYLEGGKHDNVVLAVKNGSVDVGTVRSDTLERMQNEGKIRISDFRILNQIKDDFPFAHSTRLYPEWPMAALANTNKNLANKVTTALQAMLPDTQAAKSAHIAGWTTPADYSPVSDCLRAIKHGAFTQD